MESDWTRDELAAAVDAYIEMRDLDLAGKKFVKKRFYEKLNKRFERRSTKAFEYRMQNISYVFSLLGRDWIPGLIPAKNVGSNIITTIQELIEDRERQKTGIQTDFERDVDNFRQDRSLPEPSGNRAPRKQNKETTSYDRDPKVVAWVLNESNGICEVCRSEAPFTKSDGHYYLEVHHLRRLADGGSDTTSNAIALCPNCHRELHYGRDRETILGRLYREISRLEPE